MSSTTAVHTASQTRLGSTEDSLLTILLNDPCLRGVEGYNTKRHGASPSRRTPLLHLLQGSTILKRGKGHDDYAGWCASGLGRSRQRAGRLEGVIVTRLGCESQGWWPSRAKMLTPPPLQFRCWARSQSMRGSSISSPLPSHSTVIA